MAAGTATPTTTDEPRAATPKPVPRDSAQYIRLGGLPEEDTAGHPSCEAGVACYEAVFEDGRIRILADGLDVAATRRELLVAMAEGRRPHILVGKLVGLGLDGAPRLAVGYSVPLYAYSIADIELVFSPIPAGRPARTTGSPSKRRDIRIAA